MCLVSEDRKNDNNEKQKLEKEIEELSTDSMSHIQVSVAFVEEENKNNVYSTVFSMVRCFKYSQPKSAL